MIISRDPFSNQDRNTEEVFHDEVTNRKIHRHLSDKNDIISEDDIRNVRTDFSETITPVGSEANDESITERAEEAVPNKDGEVVIGKNEDNSVLTPWSLLGS
ncbi:MAG: hypothetical protein ABIN67_17445 [Ferruginibacter sp.]